MMLIEIRIDLDQTTPSAFLRSSTLSNRGRKCLKPVVLIIFSCQTGDTEKLALSAAVGAIQGRALIRLRRLPDPEHSDATETLTRMRKEYVPPAEKDILGANVVILASSPGRSAL
jgi:hypothetical protein